MSSTNLKKTDLKRKIILNTIIFIILFVLIFYISIVITASKIKNLRAEIISQKIAIEKEINQEKNKGSLVGKLKEIEPDLDELSNIFIRENHELDFITTLEKIANKNKVNQEINLSAYKKDDLNLKKSQVTIKTSGNFLNVMQYLSDIESLSYYLNITNLNMASGTTKNLPEDEEKIITLELSADAYWE